MTASIPSTACCRCVPSRNDEAVLAGRMRADRNGLVWPASNCGQADAVLCVLRNYANLPANCCRPPSSQSACKLTENWQEKQQPTPLQVSQKTLQNDHYWRITEFWRSKQRLCSGHCSCRSGAPGRSTTLDWYLMDTFSVSCQALFKEAI